MKPAEKKPEIVFRIIDRETEQAVGSYSRAYCDKYDFNSASEARNANCHGIFQDEEKYKIAKYRVVYELIDDAKIIKIVGESNGVASLPELIQSHNSTTNPVTKSVYRDIISKRIKGSIGSQLLITH